MKLAALDHRDRIAAAGGRGRVGRTAVDARVAGRRAKRRRYPTPRLLGRKSANCSSVGSVDLRPLQTAQRMAAMAGTPEEQALAHEAEKVGDHEVDLAFFDALRTGAENPRQLSPEAKEIADAKTRPSRRSKTIRKTSRR